MLQAAAAAATATVAAPVREEVELPRHSLPLHLAR